MFSAQPAVLIVIGMTHDNDIPIIGQMRKRGHRRVTHGGFLKHVEGLSAAEEFRRDLGVWLAVLPTGAVFTGLTAALLLGWALPPLPDHLPVFAAVEGDRRPRRPGLICSRLRRVTRRRFVKGLPVDATEEILLRLARDHAHLDLRVIIESAIQAGDVVPRRVEKILKSRRPGVAVLREAWRACNGKAESVGEAVQHTFYDVMGIRFVPQKSIFDPEGRLCGVVDMYIPALEEGHEYDGEVHRSKKQHRVDLRREAGLARAGVGRRGFTLDDLLNHAAVVMHELDRDLGRPHRADRLRRWRRMVDNSLYSAAGQERLVNRWHRQMGLWEWSASA